MWVGAGKSLSSFFFLSFCLPRPGPWPALVLALAVAGTAWPPINSLSPNNPHRRREDDALNGVKLRLLAEGREGGGREGRKEGRKRNGKNKVSNLTRLSFAGDRNEVMCPRPRRPRAAREGRNAALFLLVSTLTNQTVLWM